MIYCVEDDDGIRELIVYALSSSGFEAKGFSCPEEFWKETEDRLPDLVLLDIMLPGEDGMTVLRKLRTGYATAHIPVIMATAKGTEYDKVIGLDSGADDYLAKPFGMMEMVSRVRAVLRRAGKEESGMLSVGNLAVNPSEHRAFSCGRSVELTLKEYDLLCLFLKNPGRVFTRDQLLAKVWGTDFAGETRTVDVHIGTLRTKLGTGGEAIETVRGVGYRLEGKK